MPSFHKYIIKVFLFLLSAILFFDGSVCAQAKNYGKPNVVLILMDDMGYGDISCYGGGPWRTPSIDKLAAEGMRFTHYYVPQAICSASRAAILTGCYPNRVGVAGALFPNQGNGLNLEEETIAEVLKQAGYSTSMIGKWHLGDDPKFLPHHQGFDNYIGLPYSNDMWPVDYDGKPVSAEHRKSQFPPLTLLRTKAGQELPEKVQVIKTLEDQSNLVSIYTKEAVKYIKSKKNQPFFLYLAHNMPHVPIAASAAFRDKSGTGLFGDVMTEIDWSVGQILKALRDIRQLENTIVIFTSDNGPWLSYGDHAGTTGGLREGKATSWDGGIKVPAIMYWKGHIPAGIVCNTLASSIDILPTIASLCKAPLPKKKIDGVDIQSLLFNQQDAQPRKELALYYGDNNLEGIISGYWKLVLPHTYRTYKKNPPGYSGWPGEIQQDSTGLSLYDLRHDAGETLDVKEKFPEVVAKLQLSLQEYRNTLGDGKEHIAGTERRGKTQNKKNKIINK